MKDDALSQPGNPCTVVPVRGTVRHLELNAKRKEKSLKWEKNPQPLPTLHPICCSVMASNMWHHPNQARNKSFPQFATANQKLCIIQARCIVSISSTNNYPSFSYNKNTHSEIWILTLVTTKTCPNHITAEESSLTVDSWINLMVQANSRGSIPWFSCLILQSITPLVLICHSTFPVICCLTAFHMCLLTNAFSLPHLKGLWLIQWRVLDFNGERFVWYKRRNPPLVVVAKNENISTMYSLATGHKSRFHFYCLISNREGLGTSL